jgi:DNA mismatch repair protein MutL
VPDKILLLPDHIANQIAAGEVIQRPASAVKELMENAVDAGATEIRLIINDAGKSMMQVVDNGRGMSETDARMCFERHATSKIRQIEDLFQIRTMGFRGEALASIAAVAQVEMKTKMEGEDTGTFIEIENSIVKKQEPVAMTTGTSIAMKNLFFNVPARRNFLKSNAAELRHIVEEFSRVALAFPNVFFSFTSNGQQLFHLEAGSLKQRIVQLLGSAYNARLVTVKEETDYLNIYGFVGKPDAAKKTRGDQYFFVNNRFIKSAYLNHAVMNAYAEMIAKDSFPLYVLFIELDPVQVDVNVHPTKQEIKFEDEKIVYAFVQAAVKHALAQFSVTPTLDFDLDPNIQRLTSIQQPFTEKKQEAAASTSIFQGFTQKNQAHFIERSGLKNWKDFYEPTEKQNIQVQPVPEISLSTSYKMQAADATLTQLLNNYIVLPIDKNILVIHQQSAHERVLYEKMSRAGKEKPMATQRSLFPVSLELPPTDALILSDILPELQFLGYMIEPFGKNAFVIQGTPADVGTGNEKHSVESLLEQYKRFDSETNLPKRERLIRALVKQQSIKPGISLGTQEMRQLVTDLFACEQPNTTADGKPVYLELKQDQLSRIFCR